MEQKHKFANKTQDFDWVIERIARCLYDDMVAYYAIEEGQQEYKEYVLWICPSVVSAHAHRTVPLYPGLPAAGPE